MSFSGEVKEELGRIENGARHCQIAELASILLYCGAVRTDASGARVIEIQSEAPSVAARCRMLLERLQLAEECAFGDARNRGGLYLGKMTAVSSTRRCRPSNTGRATVLSTRL